MARQEYPMERRLFKNHLTIPIKKIILKATNLVIDDGSFE
jgi:hypothetical protein